MSNAPAITLINASLHYQGQCLFKQLNLDIPSGQWTVLLGPSGVGKTSLLRLLAGLAADEAEVQAIAASDGLPLARRLVYMAQSDGLLPWLSVIENVLIGYRLRGQKVTAALKTQALTLLTQVGLRNIEHFKPAVLSGGMRQRVALVRTLLENKPVVLMDEPFSALDAITRFELQTLAVRLLQGRTVLLVTHDPLEALRLGEQVYVLGGRPATLRAITPPKTAIPRPIDDAELLMRQAELLMQLARAREEM